MPASNSGPRPLSDGSRLAHPCRVRNAADGDIKPSWCLEAKAHVVAGLPAGLHEDNVLNKDLLLWSGPAGPRSKRILEIYYAPFELLEPDARVVLVGVTPGRGQMVDALRAARTALCEGADGSEVLRRASQAGSFSGRLGGNLVAMLDGIGLHTALDLRSTRELFDSDRHLAAFTSAVTYPVFLDGKDYTGWDPEISNMPILVEFITRVLCGQLAAARRDALVIPLGDKAAAAVRMCVQEGAVRAEQCLLNFPHPSGQNGSRVGKFRAHREQMTAAVADWGARAPIGGA